MVYIKLEDNMDKFMRKYQNIPRSMMKMLFRAKCKKGKFEVQKINHIECMVLPVVNDKILKKLTVLANVRCWKNICVSDNLRWNDTFMRFAEENNLKVMDGKWLFKNMIEQVVEYMVDIKNEPLGSQEIGILCHRLDETIAEKIKEISARVKVCNILTNNSKQYQKLEEQIYQTNGIILNVSNNYKRALMKSNVIINFDFSESELEKCVFSKKSCLINLQNHPQMQKKEWLGRNITFFAVDMPLKYVAYEEALEGFDPSILYESFLYKKTSYRNIQKELLEDDAKILYLLDSNQQVIKNQNLNLQKTLDKITI